MNKKVNQYGSHFIDQSDIQNVIKVLENKSLTAGREVIKFENEFSRKVGSKYAVTCSNGTAALHLAILSLGIKKDDLVIVPSITFVATYNAVIMAGAQPIISDVDSHTGLIELKHVDELIKKYGRKIKAVIVVHLNGNVSKVHDIRLKYKNLRIIEDSCHALGSKFFFKKWHNVGNCKYSDFSTFSFHPVKNITTGEGGMITTNNYKMFQKLKLYRSHHITRLSLKHKTFPYKINNLGYNYRLTDFQCALGRSQLKKLNNFKNYRKKLVNQYVKNLKSKESYLKFVDDNFSDSFWHLFVLKINFKKIKMTRNLVMNKLKKKGIGSQIHYIPLYRHNYIKNYYNSSIHGKYLGSEDYYSQIITLPLHAKLNLEDIDLISKELISILEKKKVNSILI
jgi:dTDP-4-amino-4,6-dideoxygalactose transaminase